MKSLLNLAEGEVAIIRGIHGGAGIKNRLASIGIYPGASVKIVKKAPGPCIIEVSGTRLAIGRGMASKILVEG